MTSQVRDEKAAYYQWLEGQREVLEAHRWSDAFKTYPFPKLEDTVWAPLTKRLRECRVALITSGGLYLKDSQEPFQADSITGDNSYREFPVDTPPSALEVAHGHYDPTAAKEDLNCILPIDRLRELEQAGRIGGLTPTVYSFMGYQTDAWDVRNRLGPELAERVAADGADVALLAPV